jgi:uncharacterized membrane protein
VEILLGFLAILTTLSVPPLWLVVLRRRHDYSEILARLAQLEVRLAKLDASRTAMPGPAPAPPVQAPAAQPSPSPAGTPARSAVTALPVVPPPQPSPRPPTKLRQSLEEQIMRRWAVWIGALALALGGVFLVKYSIEQGFVGPAVRVSAGLVLGLALVAMSEVARRWPLTPLPLGAVPPDYVPSALAASGVAVLFASLYAGYALYGLIPPTLAFVLLAIVALGGAVLSLWHGPFLALLGLAGAYVVPFLVTTDEPSVPSVLTYVLVVTAACLWLVHWRDWAWLGWTAIAGSTFWMIAALAVGSGSDEYWLGCYLLLLAPLYPAMMAGDQGSAQHRAVVGWSGASIVAVLMLVLVLWADVDAASLAFAWALTALYVGSGIGWRRFDRLPWLGAGLQVSVLAGWMFDERVTGSDRLGLLFVLPPPTALGSYLMTAGLVATLAGVGGFVMLWRAPRPDRWALMSAATPLAALAAVYWRVEQLEPSLPWAIAAFLLAAAFLAAVEYLAPRRSAPGFTNALAYYALATTAAIALAFTLSLRLGWLSVALSLQLPAMAWLHDRTGVPALRFAAVSVGAIVLVRLLLNPAIVDYDFGTTPILNGILYTYGISAAAFAGAAIWFRRGADDVAAPFLEAGALALTVALVSLEIRHLSGGGHLDTRSYGLTEQALHTDAWLAVAYVLLRSGRATQPVPALAWRIIAGVAAAHFVLFECLLSNPLFSSESVGTLPILDTLLLAYAVPALFGVLYYRALRRLGLGPLSRCAGVAALVIAFLYVSLEVRHLFHGNYLDMGRLSNGESYAYSAAWLLYGVALLGVGVMLRQAPLRLAGLVVGGIVAVKAFGFDMAQLAGLYRAASFLGLGASLVGLAWLYQRVITPTTGASSASDPASR